MNAEITRTFLFGLLLTIFSGFLSIYSVLRGHLYLFEGMGLSMLIVCLIVGILGLVIPEEKMRDIWTPIGVAFGITTLFLMILSVSPNVILTIDAFPFIYAITFVITYLALKLRNRGKTVISVKP